MFIEPDFICAKCDEDLTGQVEYEDYQIWYDVESGRIDHYMHVDGVGCMDIPDETSFFFKCVCCGVDFDSRDDGWISNSDPVVYYCSQWCVTKHETCKKNIEEPDIVY